MATYTTNYNLEKPDSTDAFGNFRASYNSNMDIIDQNLGGGGGGGQTLLLNTIYSDTEKKVGYWRDNKPLYQKTIYTNNATVNNEVAISVSSLNVDSLVDIKGTYDRIVNWLSPPISMVYCFDVYEGNDEQSFIRYDVDDNNIKYRIKLANNEATSYQVITIQYTKTTDTPETPEIGNVIYLPTICSDEERQVGVWRDNKPLYQKTIVKNSTDISGAGVSFDVSTLDIDTCVDVFGTCDRIVTGVGTLIYPFNAYEDASLRTYLAYSKFNTCINFSIKFYVGESTSTQYITILYTKNSDVAGSGNWNTDGTPTHHYSTNEQVIGTWYNNKPLYEKTVEVTTVASNDWTDVFYLANAVIVGYENSTSYAELSNGECVPLDWFVTSAIYNRTIVTDSKRKFRVETKGNSYSKIVAVMRYTKTTD